VPRRGRDGRSTATRSVANCELVDGAAIWPAACVASRLVRAGEPPSTDRLVEDLWRDGGSDGAARTVQSYVSQLRKLLRGGATLQTRPGGYVLEIDRADVDAYRFERAVTAASAEPDPVHRLSTVDDAPELW
jgi:DNA-binding SARP family transcriptional activator